MKTEAMYVLITNALYQQYLSDELYVNLNIGTHHCLPRNQIGRYIHKRTKDNRHLCVVF